MSCAVEDERNAQETTFAAAFDDEDTDLILQSRDDIKFRVYKVTLLARSSTVFKDMFAVPPEQSSTTDVQVVELTKDGSTIHNFLSLCYPESAFETATLGDLSPLITACDKYFMDGPMKKVRRMLMLMEYAQEQPLCVFAMACRAKLEDEAKQAAFLSSEVRDLSREDGGTSEVLRLRGDVRGLEALPDALHGSCCQDRQQFGSKLDHK